MSDVQIAMTVQERDALAELLDTALKEARLEEHRTRTPSFREHIIQRETIIMSLLQKLGRTES